MASNFYDNLLTALAPHMKLLSDTGGREIGAAGRSFDTAEGGFQTAIDYYRNIMSGDRANLLRTLDASAVTKGLDEQAQQNYELAPRGGRRAATAANQNFSKFSELNKILQAIRADAPGKLAETSAGLGGLAGQRQGAGLSALDMVTQLRFAIEKGEFAGDQADADRKAALIGGIFAAAGSAAGAFFGSRGGG